MKRIPKFLRKYFWDINISELDIEKYSRFVIERILEFGNKEAVKWMEKEFDQKEIERVLKLSKRLSSKTANFWRFILGVNKNEILCLKKSFLKKQRIIWKY